MANASLYEGGSSVSEAVLMAMGVTERTGEVLIAESVHPEYRQTLDYLRREPELHGPHAAHARRLPEPRRRGEGCANDNTVAVVAQSPNFFGHLEEMKAIGDAARKKPARCSSPASTRSRSAS